MRRIKKKNQHHNKTKTKQNQINEQKTHKPEGETEEAVEGIEVITDSDWSLAVLTEAKGLPSSFAIFLSHFPLSSSYATVAGGMDSSNLTLGI